MRVSPRRIAEYVVSSPGEAGILTTGLELVQHAPPIEALLGGAFITAGTAAFKLLRESLKGPDAPAPTPAPETTVPSTAEPPVDPTPPPPEPRPPPAEPTPPATEPTPPATDPTPPSAEPAPPDAEPAEPELF
jgi:hypothetical protein